MKTVFLTALTALALGFSAAEAAPEQFTGTWQCHMGNQPPAGGSNFDLWLYTFEMKLTAQGGFTANGKYEAASAGFAVPFVITDGTWREAEGGMAASGKWTNGGMPQDFHVAGTLQQDGTITYSTTSGYGTLSVACRR